MRISVIHLASAATIGLLMALANAPASAKTTAECNTEYAANKAAIKGAGTSKADFVAACKAGTETIPEGAASSAPAEPTTGPPTTTAAAAAGTKSASACNAEYAANKDAIKAGGQKKKDFIASCRAGTETIPTAAAAPGQAPAVTAAPALTPAPAPMAPAPTAPKPNRVANATVAGGFASDTQAKVKCPSDTVVWVNTKSGVYHFAGTHNYGNTRQGTYMCEADAKAAGERAAENEKHR